MPVSRKASPWMSDLPLKKGCSLEFGFSVIFFDSRSSSFIRIRRSSLVMLLSIVTAALLTSSVLALPLHASHEETSFVPHSASSASITYTNTAVWYRLQSPPPTSSALEADAATLHREWNFRCLRKAFDRRSARCGTRNRALQPHRNRVRAPWILRRRHKSPQQPIRHRSSHRRFRWKRDPLAVDRYVASHQGRRDVDE